MQKSFDLIDPATRRVAIPFEGIELPAYFTKAERAGGTPAPTMIMWGYDDVDTFIKAAEAVNLNGGVEQITCPFLITHGENDRQINVSYAHQSYEQAIKSLKHTLRIFTPKEGATEHVGLDHLPHVGAFTADWIESTFAELDRV